VKFVIGIVANALALALAAWLLAGIRLTDASRTSQVITLVLVALIFGVINAVVRPVVKLLSLPFIILTLGLLIFVINALMLLLTSWISGQVGLGFHVDGFWTAIFGGIFVMVATWVIELVLPDGR
jgi:putative membrane protein